MRKGQRLMDHMGQFITQHTTPMEIDDFSDLLAAAAASAGFWDNPWDDAAWTDAEHGKEHERK